MRHPVAAHHNMAVEHVRRDYWLCSMRIVNEACKVGAGHSLPGVRYAESNTMAFEQKPAAVCDICSSNGQRVRS